LSVPTSNHRQIRPSAFSQERHEPSPRTSRRGLLLANLEATRIVLNVAASLQRVWPPLVATVLRARFPWPASVKALLKSATTSQNFVTNRTARVGRRSRKVQRGCLPTMEGWR